MSFTFDFTQIFDEYIAANQKVWAHDRSTTIGASEAFSCLRQNWYTKFGASAGIAPDEDEQRWGAMERGNIIEDHYVVPALQGHLPEGVELLYAGQANQKTLVDGRNSSTPDGLFIGIPNGPVTIKWRDGEYTIPDVQEGCIGLEIKSIDPRATLSEERAKHRGQAQIGLGIIRETTEYKPRYWIILYVDASFLDNLKPFVVEYDPDVYAIAKTRAEQVFAAKDPMDLMPEGRFDNSCQYCRFKTACGAAIIRAYEQTAPVELDNPFLLAEAEARINEYAQAKEAAAAAEEKVERLAQGLKDFMMTQNARKLASPEYRANWIKMPGRKSLDRAAMTRDGIDLEKYEREGQAYEFIKLTKRSKSRE